MKSKKTDAGTQYINEQGLERAGARLNYFRETYRFVLQTAPHDRKRVSDLIKEITLLEKAMKIYEEKHKEKTVLSKCCNAEVYQIEVIVQKTTEVLHKCPACKGVWSGPNFFKN